MSEPSDLDMITALLEKPGVYTGDFERDFIATVGSLSADRLANLSPKRAEVLRKLYATYVLRRIG